MQRRRRSHESGPESRVPPNKLTFINPNSPTFTVNYSSCNIFKTKSAFEEGR